MKKMSEKIHHQFISGKINSAIFNYMQKIAYNVDDTDALLFDGHIKKLAAWGAQTSSDCEQYFHIYANAQKAFKQIVQSNISTENSDALCKYAFLNRNKYNFSIGHNFSRLILDFMKENKDLIKNSHPNNAGIEGEIQVKSPYNIDKWIETMRHIYDASNTNNLPLDSVTKQVTAKWDEAERINFQRWMRYYQEGNYNKYNVKTAQFFQSRQEEGKVPDLKPVKDLFDTSAFPKPDPAAEKQHKLDEVRKKLLGRFKSVVELLDKYRGVLPNNTSDELLTRMHELQKTVWKLSMAASIVDSINRTSNQFKKHGFAEGAKELRKIAQEVAENKLPAAAPEGPREIPAPNAELDAPEVSPTSVSSVAQPIPEVDHIRVPEVSIGEEKIEIPDFSSATHRDALLKLEEINKVISERNVVRALAAVDIILGQLGIASYFPQLSEAQSKMMDAFNYAGTRVAETIGQMRGGSGGPVAVTPPKQDDAVEVSEEVEKPVGEVVSGGPPSAAPAPAPKAPVK